MTAETEIGYDMTISLGVFLRFSKCRARMKIWNTEIRFQGNSSTSQMDFKVGANESPSVGLMVGRLVGWSGSLGLWNEILTQSMMDCKQSWYA